MGKSKLPIKLESTQATAASYKGVTSVKVTFGLCDADAVAALPACTDVKDGSIGVDYTLEMYARNAGATDWGDPLAAIDGKLSKMKDPADPAKMYPHFSIPGSTLAYPFSGSDFSIGLSWDTKDNLHFYAPNDDHLYFPWTIDPYDPKNIQLAAILKPKGSTTDKGALESLADVSPKHTAVPLDGTSTVRKGTFFGIGTVYPIDMGVVDTDSNGKDVWVNSPKIPFDKTAGKLNVYLHESVRTGVESIDAKAFDLAAITKNVNQILSAVGFTNIAVTELKDADPLVTSIWVTNTSPVKAKNVVDTESYKENEGTDVPFFDFYVFYSTRLDPEGSEIAHGEAFNAVQYPKMTKSKRLIKPITIVGKSGSPFKTSFPSADDKAAYLATVICHEIGHSFGLQHSLDFDGSAYAQAEDNGTMSPAVSTKTGVKPFGPVHTAVLKKKCSL